MAVSAPALASWYELPHLAPIIWACALVPTLNGLGNIGLLAWARKLEFKRLFVIQALRAGSSLLVSVPAVLIFRNEWALVTGQLSTALVGLLISYVAHPYRPRLDFNLARAKTLLKFGRWVTGGALLAFLITQGDDLFVSKMLGPVALGYYQFAYQNANLPATKITHVIGQVSFPTYSRLQKDAEELKRAFRGVARFTILFAGLLTVLIWFLIPHVVEHVVGPKWEPVIPLVRILAVAGLLRAIAALAGALFMAVGKPELDFRMNLPRFLVIALSIYPLTMWKGLEGASWAVLLGILACAPTWVGGVRSLAGVKLRELLSDNALALIASGIVTAAFLVLQPHFDMSWSGSLSLLASVLASSALLLALLGRLAPSLDIFREARALRSTLAKR
jgi:O-antigen/teichoic acid export membrane protein